MWLLTTLLLARASDVPLHAMTSGLVALEVRVGDQSLPMLLDLGASATVLTQATRTRLGLTDPWRTIDATAINGTIPADLYRGLLFEVGGISFAPSVVAVIDLSAVEKEIGGEFGGILGADFLDVVDLALDREGGTAQVFPRGTFEPQQGWSSVRLRRRRGGLWTEALVDGRAFPALIDTGADATGLDPGVTGALSLELVPLPGKAAQGADGRPIALAATSLRTLSVGGSCLQAGVIQASAEPTTGRTGAVHLGVDRLFAQPIGISMARRALFFAPHACE